MEGAHDCAVPYINPRPKSVRTGGDVGDIVGVGRVDTVLDQPQALAQRRPRCRPHEASTVSTHPPSRPEYFLIDKTKEKIEMCEVPAHRRLQTQRR